MSEVEWIAEVFPDWTTLRTAAGDFAFQRETGRVFKIPHPECPFIHFPAPPKENERG